MKPIRMLNSAVGVEEVLTRIETSLSQKISVKDNILSTREQASYEDYLRIFHANAALREALKVVEGIRKELS